MRVSGACPGLQARTYTCGLGAVSARRLPFDGTSREAYTLLVRQACWLGLALLLAAACGSPSPSAPTRTSAPNINPPAAGPVNRPPSVYLPAFFTPKEPPDSPTL